MKTSLLLALTLTLPAVAQSPWAGPAPAGPPLTTDSKQQPGVPTGTLSEKLTHVSKIYDGLRSDYWIYVPAQYDQKVPAALMVFQDGSGYLDRQKSTHPALNVLDNLIAQKKIPMMIAVFINPGDISGSPDSPLYKAADANAKRWNKNLAAATRSIEYDTVSDRYARFLHDELLPEVEKKYNIRKDAYSRAITGSSSGGICSFNVAWQQPEQFSRVISWIGSFSSLQWQEQPGIADGGQDFPDKVLREPHRNMRVWLQDGNNDQENPFYGSWPLSNIRLANALKLKLYDFRFSFGQGPHSQVEGGAEFPEEMIWLWRGYDPAKTSETYEQDPAEKALPPFRVAIVNREAK
ncbi:MAG TPA: alpha/beta hydrolase-fold protein [Granulicella sp.]